MTRPRIFGMAKTPALEASDAPMPAIHGIYWLKRNPKTDQLLFIIKWVSYLLPFVVFAVIAYTFFQLGLDNPENLTPAKQEKLDHLKKAIGLMFLTLAGLPFIVTFAFANMRRQLGTDGHRIYVRMSDGTQVSFAPEQLVYGFRQIRCKELGIAVQTGHGQSLYADGELETYIAPLLKRATKLGSLAVIRHELTHPDRLMIFTALYLGMLGVLLVASGLLDKG